MSDSKHKLLPCPICTSSHLHIIHRHNVLHIYYVICKKCGYVGKYSQESEEDTINIWNTRPRIKI
jgi:Lar family restriction alleviation protein